MKRLFDIFFSTIGLLLFLPLFAVVAILIKLESIGPVFFVQKRIGKGLKPFALYKFRTMVNDSHEKGLSITDGGDLRITRVGRFLRKTKIDELPQLINVLKGDMSLVGPRPEVEKYVNIFKEDHREILKIRPGITDIASLTYSNEEAVLKDKKDPEEYYINILLPQKIILAKEYVRRSSTIYDLKLIILTIFKLVYPQDGIRKIITIITPFRRPIIIGIQLIIFIISNYLAFFIRFDADVPPSELDLFLKYLPLLILFRFVCLFVFSLDKGLWRYVSVRDLFNITGATSLGSLMFFIGVMYIFGEISYPKSIYVIDWFFNIFLLSGVRLLRQLHEIEYGKQIANKRIIVIGAGDAAEMLLRNIKQNSLYNYEVIGLIDDNLKTKGLKIRNVPILGTRKDLITVVKREKPDEFIIGIPSASPSKLKGIVNDLRQYGLPVKTIPNLWGILSGRDSLSKIRVIEPEDVLFRAPSCDEFTKLKNFFEGKRVMITGAGGSIGSEISRQIASCRPECLILFERHEESLFKIDMELRSLMQEEGGSREDRKLGVSEDGRKVEDERGGRVEGGRIVSVIGDILDEMRVSEIMERFRPQVVLHAAAYKHVPLMEDNSFEAFKTNVIGTKIIAEKAREFGAERFILISTDKAVNPVNIMGMTKKIAEEVVQYLGSENGEKIEDGKLGGWEIEGERWKRKEQGARRTEEGERIEEDGKISTSTKYIIVRFGNVLGSSGSVVPFFKEQIKRGGPVTVTHPDITRYFMTIPEAVNFVLQAAAIGNSGEVFVLDMGKPVKIVDLAKRMISLYGFKPGVDIDISFTGLRPGEKLYEELFNSYEVVKKTSNPKIDMAFSNRRINQNILEVLKSLNNPEHLRDKADVINIYNKLTQEKREHRRYYLRLSFSYILENNEKGNSGKLINVGFGGFSAKLNQLFLIGDKMNINFLLSENGRQTRLLSTAEVVWTCNGDNCPRYGFRFINMDERQTNILKRYLRQSYRVNTVRS